MTLPVIPAAVEAIPRVMENWKQMLVSLVLLNGTPRAQPDSAPGYRRSMVVWIQAGSLVTAFRMRMSQHMHACQHQF